jgi:hypothetical protein
MENKRRLLQSPDREVYGVITDDMYELMPEGGYEISCEGKPSWAITRQSWYSRLLSWVRNFFSSNKFY